MSRSAHEGRLLLRHRGLDPFRRDPLAELAAECRRQGIRLCFYYSQLDWRCGDEPDRVIAIELRRPRR